MKGVPPRMQPSNPLRIVDSCNLQGFPNYMKCTALGGVSDAKSGILSVWVRMAGQGVIWRSGDGFPPPGFYCNSFGPSPNVGFGLDGRNAAGTQILSLGSSQIYSNATWHHVLFSWDLAIAAGHVYVNDVSDVGFNSPLTNDTIDYTQTNNMVGGLADGSIGFNSLIAEFYFAPGQYLDFSIVANRRKFRSATGKPVHLGTDGALPTGSKPCVYCHMDDGEAVANFVTNRAGNGNFTISGTFLTGSSSPSD